MKKSLVERKNKIKLGGMKEKDKEIGRGREEKKKRV